MIKLFFLSWFWLSFWCIFLFFVIISFLLFFFFFFQAEDGIRDLTVTGVQTCALPILRSADHLKQIYTDKLNEVQQRLNELLELRSELETALNYLDSCNTLCAPALAPTNCAHCDRHSETRSGDLIAGALA